MEEQPLKPATGRLLILEDQYLKLKNAPINKLVACCSLLDKLKRNRYSEAQLDELEQLINK